MNITEQLKQVDAMVTQGNIANAVKDFFAENASTSDYGQVNTSNKQEMIEKMEGFLNAIANVNGITFHQSVLQDKLSFSEFTFDFAMKDGSSIFWHEIIKRQWNEAGKIIREEYFDAKN
jgi:hypothetical protein